MSAEPQDSIFLICDDNAYVRRLVADVLIGGGFGRHAFAQTGDELLEATHALQPRVVVTSSRVPGLSGLAYTRLIRAGYKNVSRTLSIIVMTNTPTVAFMDAARDAGVDEMLVRPFTAQALLDRVDAVLARPRRFVESLVYTGPCRRRRMIDPNATPRRRLCDPLEAREAQEEAAATSRELVRKSIAKIGALAAGLTQIDRAKLREIYAAVGDTERFANEARDEATGDAARSLLRYIRATGAGAPADPDVFRAHIDAMQKLAGLRPEHHDIREEVVRGLVAIVDKRLKRKPQAA
ncbi:MAG: response regulator transcription factor [Hydrogenophilaceae bacterium]|jgi:DNA-binding response OmpR family regulator|nr:response regulator transcription factor [Hydrogenophilaceae bacterium]